MPPISFDYPYLLPLALVLPVLAALCVIWSHRRRQARLARLGTESMVARLVPAIAIVPPRWRAVRLALAAGFAGFAIAGPRWGEERVPVSGEGVDVALVLDASLSMLARDERPSRLERMKQEVRRLRALSGGDRIGLLGFAGRSYILTPLTVDNTALDLFLDNFDPSVVGQPGTSLARPIRQATSVLQAAKSPGDKALIVMTDGEAHEPVEDIIQAAKEAGEAGVSLVIVGFGTTEGTTIPVRVGNTVTEHRDADGQIVVTRYRPDILRAVAEAGNGTFIDAAETNKAARVRRALSSLRAVKRVSAAGLNRTPRFQLFLVPALLLLLADTLLVERRGRRVRGAAAATPSDSARVGKAPEVAATAT